MAAVSLSPNPIFLSTMSSRRIPLSTNQNVANSPIRASAAASSKPKRTLANLQREDAYAQPPPAKKQMLESGIPRPLKSPAQPRAVKSQVTLQSRRNASTYESKLARERTGHHHQGLSTTATTTTTATATSSKYTEKDLEEIRQWQSHHRARFPKMVFYFENIPEDIRVKVAKQITSLGAVRICPIPTSLGMLSN